MALSVAAAMLLGSAAGLIGNAINHYSTSKTNQTNADINQKNLDYNAAMTQQQWERDDTAHQREVADLEAAGLSPLAALGGAPNGSPLGAPNPIAMQAPQIDTNSITNSMLQGAELQEKKRHNIEEENLRSDEIANTSKQIQLKSRELDLDDKKLEEEIKYRANLIDLESKRISETERANKANEDIKEKQINLEKLSYESKRYFEEIKHQTGGEDVPYKVYDNYEAYLTAREIYLNAFNEFIEEVGATRHALGDSTGHGFNINGQYAATGGGIGANQNDSAYEMKDWTQQNNLAWKRFQQKYPVPVFYYKD